MKRLLIALICLSIALQAQVKREEVAQSDKWNLEALYESIDVWQRDLDALVPNRQAPFFPLLNQYKDHLHESPVFLLETLTNYHDVQRRLVKLYIFAHLHHCEDLANPQYKALNDKIMQLWHQFEEETSWLQPQILSMSQEQLQEYCEHPLLADYKTQLKNLITLKPHVLDQREEQVAAILASGMDTPAKAFAALNNADIKFGKVEDTSGELHELTLGSYSNLLKSEDRTLRKNAFMALSKKYLSLENTLTELYAGSVKARVAGARLRKYSNALDAALKPSNIDVEVYHSLIKAVHERISTLHRYNALRKKMLAVDTLHAYDLYVPLVSGVDRKYPFDEATQLVLEAVKPLGKEYQSLLRDGLINQRWVDRYENENKRSGGFSSGCYDSMPYILMNYDYSLHSVFTLAHEAGHSMHTLYSNKNQPSHYSRYPIFVAEVASTFNESLLRNYLLDKSDNEKERTYLINEAIEDIRSAIFRQTMFAEFELFAHEAEEKRIPLTAQLLKDKYLELCRFYFGDAVKVDPELAIEWARIPHFYNAFYVYQYATGISAAISLSDMVITGGEQERERYLDFLRAGGSDFPINILAKAGCDMRKPEPVERTLLYFESLVNELEQLLDKQASP